MQRYYSVGINDTWTIDAVTADKMLSMIKTDNKSIKDARLHGDKSLFIEGKMVAHLFKSANAQVKFLKNQGII